MPISLHLPQIALVFKSEKEKLGVKPLYLNIFLTRLSQYFSAVFVPVYLLQIGLNLFGEGALTASLGFLFALMVLVRLTTLLTIFPAAWAARAFGFRWTILFANVLRAGVFVLLSLADENVLLLIPTMVFYGLVAALYWPSFHTIFTEDGTVGSEGESVGWRIVAEKVAGVIGPLVGGVIITLFGFTSLFAVAVIVMILACIPVFFMHHHDHADRVSWQELSKWLREFRFKKAGLSFVGGYINDISMTVIWPVFVFLVVASYERLGLIFSLTTLVAVIASWFAGKLFDAGHQRKLFKVGSVATAVVWLVRAALKTFTQVLVVDSVEKLVSVFYRLPYLAYSYKRARGSQAFSFMVYRELLISLGAVIFWLVAVGLLFFPWFWFGLFGLAALGVMVSQFILESND